MAEKRTFRIEAMEQGWCCAHGCLAIEDIKARGKGQVGISPLFFVQKFGFEVASGKGILNDWKRHGKYQCERLAQCMLAKVGLVDDDIPSIGEDRRRYEALKGRTFGVYRTKTEPTRDGEPIRGVVMNLSKYDWLYVVVALPEADPSIKLGDQLFLDALLWGTVIDIDGPNITLLLPGHHHRLRHNKIFRNKSS